jgi:hypothetical protein
MTGNLVFLAGAASMPWQVAALTAAGRAARFGVPLAAAATAATLLSGDAQVAIVSAAFGAALAAERGGLRGLARAAGATLLGGALASVQVVPTLAAIAQSRRAGGLDAIERQALALSPWRLLELAVPGMFARLDSLESVAAARWLGGPWLPGVDLPFALSVHLGVPAVALAACAPFRERRVAVVAGAATLALWLALGHHADARPALDGVPIWGAFRYTEKMVAPLSLALALLAAFGARTVDGARPVSRRLLAAALGCVALVVLAALIASAIRAAPWDAGRALARNLVAGLPYTVAGAAVAAAAAFAPSPWRAPALAAGVGAALVAALPFAWVRSPLEPCRTWPGALTAEPPGPRLDLPYLDRGVHPDGAAVPSSLREALLEDDCGRGAIGADARSVRDGVDVVGNYGGLGPRRLSLLLASLPDPATAGLLPRWFSATHESVVPASTDLERALREAATGGGVRVAVDPRSEAELWAVPHAPWARFPAEVAVVRTPEEAVDALLEAVREQRDGAVVETVLRVGAGRGVVRAVARAPERLALEVDVAEPGLLVVNDAFAPGWVARVDGTETSILAANVLARGVVVPAGRHAVTMSYEPREVRVGLAVSLLALAACAALAALEVCRRRRDAASPGPPEAARLGTG